MLGLDKTPNHLTLQSQQTVSQIQCVITGDLASNRHRIMHFYAGRTRFPHFYAVVNCILRRPETAGDVVSGRFVGPIAHDTPDNFLILSLTVLDKFHESRRRRHFRPYFARR